MLIYSLSCDLCFRCFMHCALTRACYTVLTYIGCVKIHGDKANDKICDCKVDNQIVVYCS